jgi:hypothetical protein
MTPPETPPPIRPCERLAGPCEGCSDDCRECDHRPEVQSDEPFREDEHS